MELEGAKRSFAKIKEQEKLTIDTFVSDRHRGIGKWIKETQKDTTHFYDIWHQAKSITKKILKISKEKGCEILAEWMKSIKNHLYWCATSTKAGFGALIEAKWLSFLRHVNNEHEDHPNQLFKQCHHGEIETNKKWIKVGKNLHYYGVPNTSPVYILQLLLFCDYLGTKPYQKLREVLSKPSLLKDIRKLSPVAQTSSLEGFHSVLNHWHPKMVCFSWLGTYCRCINLLTYCTVIATELSSATNVAVTIQYQHPALYRYCIVVL